MPLGQLTKVRLGNLPDLCHVLGRRSVMFNQWTHLDLSQWVLHTFGDVKLPILFGYTAFNSWILINSKMTFHLMHLMH